MIKLTKNTPITKLELLVWAARKVANDNPDDPDAKATADECEAIHREYENRRIRETLRKLEVIKSGPDRIGE